MQPFIINPMTGFLMEDTDAHLPIDDGSQNPKPYATNDGFRFPGGLTQQEEDLLKQYGKVFFYEVNIFENGNLIDHAVLYPEVETLAAGHPDWKPAETTPGSTVQMQGIAPSLGTAFDLFYYRNTNLLNGTDWDPTRPKDANECDSREVVFRVSPSLSRHNITGGSVPKILYVGFSQNPFTFWQNSSLNLMTY